MNATTELNKWNLLLEQTDIIYRSYDGLFELTGNVRTSTLEELSKFEKETSIVLPQDYKYFCQVFGDGEFGYTQFAINIPNQEEDEDIFRARQMMIDTYHDTKEVDSNRNIKYTTSDNARIKIENSYRFGTGQGYIHFVFDITTYSTVDLSCDIYAFRCDGEPSYVFLGRDFFYFIKFFCLGKQAEIEFPYFFSFEYDDDDDDDDDDDLISKSGAFFPSFLNLEFSEEDTE